MEALKTDNGKALAATVAGGAIGAAAKATVGGVGLAALGTAVAVPLVAFVAAGAVVGLASFGLYKVIKS